jgi:hypothetical protein
LAGVPSPAKVVSLLPAAADTGTEQDRVGAPSRWTVQAPHCASPQPKCGLLSPSSLRSTYKSGDLNGAPLSVQLEDDALGHFQLTDRRPDEVNASGRVCVIATSNFPS